MKERGGFTIISAVVAEGAVAIANNIKANTTDTKPFGITIIIMLVFNYLF